MMKLRQRNTHINLRTTPQFNGNPPPNDDIDLQLVWLIAVEKYGSFVNASILGDYWLTYIIPDWVEYGAGKNNLKMGLQPPLSGYLDNNYKDSNGCFIRSEIWACLAPGQPEIAARYAYEDGIVDHADEGLFAEIFCATIESAAFVENDRNKLIDIGLSYIPENCGVAKAVKVAIEAHKSGKSWELARKDVLSAVPGSFGIQCTKLKDIPDDIPAGKAGYDAPSNIGIIIIGWLYGEGDFGKSICIANNCGEDTDCTAATLGSILGICGSYQSIPEKWIAPIGDNISTCCINVVDWDIEIPRTISELTDRILRVVPIFLGRKLCDLFASPEGYSIEVQEPHNLYCVKGDQYIRKSNGAGKPVEPQIEEMLQSSKIVRYRFTTFNAEVDYLDSPYVRLNQSKKIKLSFICNNNKHQWLTVRWYAQDGVEVLPNKECSFPLKTTYKDKTELTFMINVTKFSGNKTELLADVSVNGRHTYGVIKITLIPMID